MANNKNRRSNFGYIRTSLNDALTVDERTDRFSYSQDRDIDWDDTDSRMFDIIRLVNTGRVAIKF